MKIFKFEVGEVVLDRNGTRKKIIDKRQNSQLGCNEYQFEDELSIFWYEENKLKKLN